MNRLMTTPMDVRIDPMDRLFLVNIADDPVYEGVDLQTFPGHGVALERFHGRAHPVGRIG